MDNSNRHELDLLISGKPVNSQILKMIGRKVPVIKSDLLWEVLNRFRRSIPYNSIWIFSANHACLKQLAGVFIGYMLNLRR